MWLIFKLEEVIFQQDETPLHNYLTKQVTQWWMNSRVDYQIKFCSHSLQTFLIQKRSTFRPPVPSNISKFKTRITVATKTIIYWKRWPVLSKLNWFQDWVCNHIIKTTYHLQKVSTTFMFYGNQCDVYRWNYQIKISTITINKRRVKVSIVPDFLHTLRYSKIWSWQLVIILSVSV